MQIIFLQMKITMIYITIYSTTIHFKTLFIDQFFIRVQRTYVYNNVFITLTSILSFLSRLHLLNADLMNYTKKLLRHIDNDNIHWFFFGS